MEQSPTGKSIAEQLKEKEMVASGMIKRGQDELEETKRLVSENLGTLTDEASADYAEATKKKIKEAADKGDFDKAASLSAEIKKHLQDLETQKRKNSPWWKRYPEEWKYESMPEADFVEAEEFIKSNSERAREIAQLNTMDYRQAEAKMAQLSRVEKKVLAYFSHKDDLVNFLKKEGRTQEASEV